MLSAAGLLTAAEGLAPRLARGGASPTPGPGGGDPVAILGAGLAGLTTAYRHLSADWPIFDPAQSHGRAGTRWPPYLCGGAHQRRVLRIHEWRGPIGQPRRQRGSPAKESRDAPGGLGFRSLAKVLRRLGGGPKTGHEKIYRQLPDLCLSLGVGGLRGRGSENNVERESQTDGQGA